MKLFYYLFLSVIVISCNTPNNIPNEKSSNSIENLAKTPPMGWNSYDAYDCRINEKDFLAHVDFMAENLLEYGYEYAVIDYIWWHPEPGNWENPRRIGHPNIRYRPDGSPLHPEYINMDENGRLLPSEERFPSAKDGKGFKPVADYVHSKGMKFGIHIMRGIHRMAWSENTPILGSDSHARDIAETHDTCAWCNHMYGVDPAHPASQEYYNSLFKLYADWGVDFIKADDILHPQYHSGEIEMINKAIKNCGRPMVLSLSPGEAPLSRANHLKEYSNMWRVSGDFWDNWESLEHNFDLLNSWSSHIGTGHWPDADMLPLGKVSLQDRPHGQERESNFTWNEQITMMTLWSMARSPLMIGADLLSISDSTLSLLTNEEVLNVNQYSINNRQIIKTKKVNHVTGKTQYYCIWQAEDPKTGAHYIALFNLADESAQVCYDLEWDSLRDKYTLRDLWKKEDIGTISDKLCAKIEAHGAVLYKLTKN